MSHRSALLSTLETVAVVVAVAACGGSQQQTNTPTAAADTTPPGSFPKAGPDPALTASENQPPQVTHEEGAPRPASAMGMTEDRSRGSTAAQPGASTNAGSSPMTNPQSATPDTSSLRDPEIAAVLSAINQGEVQEAQLAIQKASSGDVKRFARNMLSAHGDMLKKEKMLFARLQITPMDNAVSRQLKNDVQTEQVPKLQGLHGKDFDRDDMQGQIEGHRHALDLLDRMIPEAQNTDLKTDMQNARPMVEEHLRAADDVLQKLQQ